MPRSNDPAPLHELTGAYKHRRQHPSPVIVLLSVAAQQHPPRRLHGGDSPPKHGPKSPDSTNDRLHRVTRINDRLQTVRSRTRATPHRHHSPQQIFLFFFHPSTLRYFQGCVQERRSTSKGGPATSARDRTLIHFQGWQSHNNRPTTQFFFTMVNSALLPRVRATAASNGAAALPRVAEPQHDQQMLITTAPIVTVASEITSHKMTQDTKGPKVNRPTTTTMTNQPLSLHQVRQGCVEYSYRLLAYLEYP
jgi:hypothetical protein